MVSSHYAQIDIEASQESAQDVVHLQQLALDHYDCLGIEEYALVEQEVDAILGERSFSGGNLPDDIIDEVDSWQSLQQNSRCKLFFRDEDTARRFLLVVQKEFPQIRTTIQNKEEEDWSVKWQDNYHSLAISSQIMVIPSWEKGVHRLPVVPYPIYIYPGRGFGTGSHETTWMCMEMIETVAGSVGEQRGEVLDFGCGSGILGILAHKLGWNPVVLYDIDPEALENTRQNLKENFFEEQMTPFSLLLPIDRHQMDKPYHLVLANILMNVLVEERDWLVEHTAEGGWLILSGILADQAADVIKCYGSLELELVAQKNRGDWVSLLWRKTANNN